MQEFQKITLKTTKHQQNTDFMVTNEMKTVMLEKSCVTHTHFGHNLLSIPDDLFGRVIES
jgi:hypothetical protein